MPHPTRPPDPVRDPLVEVRRALLRLHRALIDAERPEYERDHGTLTSTAFLAALLEEPFFQWLRPYSMLVVEMDEAIFAREPIEPERARSLVADAQALLAPAAEGDRLTATLDRDPAALLARAELQRRISAALRAYGEP
jgi:hypothetical protein